MKYVKLFEKWIVESAKYTFSDTDYTKITKRHLPKGYFRAFVDGLKSSHIENPVVGFKVSEDAHGVMIEASDESSHYFYMWSEDDECWNGGYCEEMEVSMHPNGPSYSGKELIGCMSPEEFLHCLHNDNVLKKSDMQSILTSMSKYPEQLGRKYGI